MTSNATAVWRETDRRSHLHPFTDHKILASYLGEEPGVQIRMADGFAALKAQLPPPTRRGIVLIDPPYASEEPARAFEALVGSSVLSPGAMLVLERDRRHPSPNVEGLSAADERRYGDTVVARFAADPTE